jgi:IS4 transposase
MNSACSFAPGFTYPPSLERTPTTGSFPPSRTFWLFLSQVLDASGSCRETLRKFLVWLAVEENATASPSTAGYCKARARLRQHDLDDLHRRVVRSVESSPSAKRLWCGRRVKVVDGSSLSMPDTPANQTHYPQPSMQKEGCGFPVMRIVGLFSLHTGVLIDLAKDSLAIPERTLFRRLWDQFELGDVALADTGFTSYADFYYLGLRGVDSVMRNHQKRTKGLTPLKRLGKNDRLVEWHKTKIRPKWLSRDEWAAIPERLTVRELTVHVDVPGFRTDIITIATTLLDAKAYPASAIAQLYRDRWAVELFLRHIKITMGMDILRCKTPAMVHKEVTMHLIAYNLVRALMLDG